VWEGGKNVRIPTLSLQGLATYSTDTGYVSGAVTYSYQTATLTMDRGRRFNIDAYDSTNTNFALTAAKVAEEFQRVKVIPEIDAYRYKKLYGWATHTTSYTPAKSTIYDLLAADIAYVNNLTEGEGELVISISRSAYDLLLRSPEMVGFTENGVFNQGEISFDVKKINNAYLIPVPQARFKSDIILAGSGAGGYAVPGSATNLNWIVVPKDVPLAFSKTENVRIIPPELNQNANAWSIDYRKYHDLYVHDAKRNLISVNFTPNQT
jgi:hypothetical protein